MITRGPDARGWFEEGLQTGALPLWAPLRPSLPRIITLEDGKHLAFGVAECLRRWGCKRRQAVQQHGAACSQVRKGAPHTLTPHPRRCAYHTDFLARLLE